MREPKGMQEKSRANCTTQLWPGPVSGARVATKPTRTSTEAAQLRQLQNPLGRCPSPWSDPGTGEDQRPTVFTPGKTQEKPACPSEPPCLQSMLPPRPLPLRRTHLPTRTSPPCPRLAFTESCH